MKKLLFLILSQGLILQSSADNVSPEEKEVNKQKAEAYHAATTKFNERLKQAGLSQPYEPIITGNLSCMSSKFDDIRLQSMPLPKGFALSFCSNSNVDFARIDKAAILKLLLEEIQKNED